MITTSVLDSDLPLLLSKSSMSRAGVIIDTSKNLCTIFGKAVKPEMTVSGHYMIPLRNSQKPQQTVLITAKTDNDKDIQKLHKQYGHCTSEQLYKLLKNANLQEFKHLSQKDVENILSDCEICRMQKRAPRRPIVSLPLATDVNESVCIDLHQLGPNLWYLHCICAFSRFSLAISLESKEAGVVISKFIKVWVSMFGPPKRAILSDNGKEFCNEKFQEFAEAYNLHLMTTGSHSPFSNGICERHNALVTETLAKSIQRASQFRFRHTTCLCLHGQK